MANSIDLRLTQTARGAASNPTSYSFKNAGFKWAHNDMPNGMAEGRGNVQSIILDEFQPNMIFDVGKVINATAINQLIPSAKIKDPIGIAGKTINLITSTAGATTTLAAQATKKALFAGLLDKYGKDQSSSKTAIDGTIQHLEQFFSGSFLNTFELPFLDETYLKADTSANWSTNGSARAFGDAIHRFLSENMSIDFPTTPVWSLGDNATAENLTFSFYLINDTPEFLVKNFKMLHSLVAGAFWMQLDDMQQSPNVYRVTVPGRFLKIYCALGVTVSMVGKLRLESNDVIKKIGFNGITNETLFPEAYKVEIIIRDLCPANFNTYINYLLNGSKHITLNKTSGTLGGTTTTRQIIPPSEKTSILGGEIADVFKNVMGNVRE